MIRSGSQQANPTGKRKRGRGLFSRCLLDGEEESDARGEKVKEQDLSPGMTPVCIGFDRGAEQMVCSNPEK